MPRSPAPPLRRPLLTLGRSPLLQDGCTPMHTCCSALAEADTPELTARLQGTVVALLEGGGLLEAVDKSNKPGSTLGRTPFGPLARCPRHTAPPCMPFVTLHIYCLELEPGTCLDPSASPRALRSLPSLVSSLLAWTHLHRRSGDGTEPGTEASAARGDTAACWLRALWRATS